MAVSNINIKLISFVIIFILSFSVQAERKLSNEDVIHYLSKKVAKSTSSLGRIIDECEIRRSNSKSALLDKNKLKKLHANRKDIIIALSYISFRNAFNCEKSARVKLAYDLGVLASSKRHLNADVKGINDIESNLIYPSIKEAKLEIKYLTLSKSLRNYVLKAVGDTPFDLLKVLKINSLLNN